MNIREHLLSRKVNFEIHSPILDEENEIATFLLYNLSGQIVGYQQYNPNGEKKVFNCKAKSKYYTYRKSPTVALFGIETLALSTGPVFLTEGLFDAARISYYGKSVLATLCNHPPKDYQNFLQCLHRPIVVICDNDNAGYKLSKYGDYVEIPNEKDLGDESEEYVLSLIEKYKA